MALFAEREAERYTLHARYMNDIMVRMLRTIGYDVGFCSAQGNISSIAQANATSIC